jgi:signal transduction histidine kinase
VNHTVGLDRRRAWILWISSYALFIFVALASSASMYRFAREFDKPIAFWEQLRVPLINNLIWATFAPLIVQIGLRYPLQRENWPIRAPLYALGGVVFTALHVLIRILVYPVIDWMTKQAYPLGWPLYRRVFLFDFPEDFFYIYLPIVLATHGLYFYLKSRDREVRASLLETQLVQAQLKNLKSQLQPHFLFNTLHSISSLMWIDVNAADKMMARLSDLLRMSMDGSGWQETTLNREIQFVHGYLEIEKMRLGDRLKVKMAIDSDTLDVRVPHLLLQPLVENAVRHGISKLPSGGSIWIGAKHEGEELHIQVGDNGPGFQAEGWGLRRNGHGLGLLATRERLYGLYGSRGLIQVHSTPMKGTVVHVRLPFNTAPLSRIAELESIHGLV